MVGSNCLGSLCAVHNTSWKCKNKLLAFLLQQSQESDVNQALSLPNSELQSLTVLAKSTNNFHCAAQAKKFKKSH